MVIAAGSEPARSVRRLFPDGGVPAALELESSLTTTTGVVIASYRCV